MQPDETGAEAPPVEPPESVEAPPAPVDAERLQRELDRVRKEAGDYRHKLREAESTWEGVRDEDRAAIQQFVAAHRSGDRATASALAKDFADFYGVLPRQDAGMASSVAAPLPPAQAMSATDQARAALQREEPLTRTEVERMLAAAQREQQVAQQRAALVSELDSLGYTQDNPLTASVVALANREGISIRDAHLRLDEVLTARAQQAATDLVGRVEANQSLPPHVPAGQAAHTEQIPPGETPKERSRARMKARMSGNPFPAAG